MPTKTKPKLKTLAEFVAEAGTQEKAAALIGVTYSTVNRWLNAGEKPHGVMRQHLLGLGINPEKLEAKKGAA